MSDKLVPIALSSEIDVSGIERVHAAPYTRTVRPTYIIPPAKWLSFGTLIPTTPPGTNVFVSEAGAAGPFTLLESGLTSNVSSSGNVKITNSGAVCALKGSGGYALTSAPPYTSWSEDFYSEIQGFGSLATDGTRLVCVRSATSKVSYSDDGGQSWTQVTGVTNCPGEYRGSISFADGVWAGGNNNTPMVWTSDVTNPVWTAGDTVSGCNTRMVRYTGSAWVAANLNGDVWRSTNRTNWTKVLNQGDIFDNANGMHSSLMCTNGSGIVLISGGVGDILAKSSDHGQTWVDVSAGLLGFTDYIECINGVFYNGNESSTDGETWIATPLSTSTFVRFDGAVVA